MKHILHKARAAWRYGRTHGLKALRQRIRQEFNSQALMGSPVFAKAEIVRAYGFVVEHPVGAPYRPGMASPNTVNWFIPQVGRGSGGHLNIFRFIRNLEHQGFDCRIIISGGPPTLDPREVEREIADWFFPLKAKAYIGSDSAPTAHISIATAWHTAYDVRNFQTTRHKCYFVQDYEPWFFPAGSLATFAEETYRFGFTGITAGTWLADMLHRDFGMTTHAVSFSYDRELYRVLPRKNPETKNIFFYARPNTARRSFELGVLVLAEVAKRHPDAIAVLAGADLSGYEIPFKHTNPGIVDLADLPALYAQCDVGLVLSFSNLSLLPLELMACGVPVVSNRAPCTEWLLSDEIALLERPTVLALANAICTVLENPQEAQRLRAAGLKASAATDWAAEGMKMGKVLQTLDAASEPSAGQESLA
ncbi:glycosyl transferase group 1 [Achromobacter sp. AONIH1]|nr:glycosyl transferase group 1 [Achromobacter sp. AONIH1]